MREVMVPYVLKIPPKMLDRVRKESGSARDTNRYWKKSLTASAYIRRAIQREFDHADRSRGRRRVTTTPASK